MLISWLDNNHDFLGPEVQTGRHLVQKFLNTSSSQRGECFNIIASGQELAHQLLGSFMNLEDAFPDLRLRFGWLNEEKDVNDVEIPMGSTILISEDNHFKRLIELNSENCLIFSSKSLGEQLHIGFQRHFKSHTNPYSVSLGELRQNNSSAHTLTRSAKNIFFHIDAIRAQESGSEHSHSTGMDIYEACQMLRLSGISSTPGIVCFNMVDNTISKKASDTVAMLVWYFLEGRINNELETMEQKENDIYLVTSEMWDEPIKFVVGHRTGRWWYQHPVTKEYMPCSQEDYKCISQGKLPDAIMALEC